MSLTPQTNEFMRHLPAALRPNPWNIEESIMALVLKGWSIADIFAAVMADRPKEPGHVVAQLRRLVEQPAPSQGATHWKYGHLHCGAHDGCEECYCTPGNIHHHVAIPMPKIVRDKFTELVRTFGKMP